MTQDSNKFFVGVHLRCSTRTDMSQIASTFLSRSDHIVVSANLYVHVSLCVIFPTFLNFIY